MLGTGLPGPRDVVEHRRPLGVRAVEEALAEPVVALPVEPGEPAPDPDRVGQFLGQDEVEELRHAGVGGRAGALVPREEQVGEQRGGGELLRGEEPGGECARGLRLRGLAGGAVHVGGGAGERPGGGRGGGERLQRLAAREVAHQRAPCFRCSTM